MKLLIDLDSAVYASAGLAQSKNKETGELDIAPLEHALQHAKNFLTGLTKKFDGLEYEAYLTTPKDETCFRTALYPEYKANRAKYDKPYHYLNVREYYITHWNAIVVKTIEADDIVSIRQWEEHKGDFTISKSIIAGIDKDLDQIPGEHFNFRTNTRYTIQPLEGLRNFYKQMLAGDAADNIPRVKKGWIKAGAFKLLENATSEDEMKELVLKETMKIKQVGMDDAIDWLERQGKLLHLRRSQEDTYIF
jgi:5'-3' exonuclease